MSCPPKNNNNIMLCSISNTIAVNPVFGVTTGLIYERSTIEKALAASNDRCPVTDLPLQAKDLVPVRNVQPQQASFQPPRSLENASIPSLLRSFQNEWDAVVLESFTLKQLLEKTRRELAIALYQNDAATRVIQRLTVERDEARQQQASAPAPAAVAPSTMQNTLTEAETKKIEEQEAVMQQDRNTRRKQAAKQQPAIKLADTHVDLTNGKATCLDALEGSRMVWGTSEGQLFVSGVSQAISLSSNEVSAVKLIPSTDLLLAVSSNEVDIVCPAKQQTTKVQQTHSAKICDVSAHTTSGEFAFALDSNARWSLFRTETGQVATQGVSNVADSVSLSAHPDGKLFALGGQREIEIWDLLRGAKIGSLSAGPIDKPGHLRFCENGVTLGCLTTSGVVEIWDMRKPTNALHRFGGGAATSFAFDDFSTLFVGFNTGAFQLMPMSLKSSSSEWPAAFNSPALAGGSICQSAFNNSCLLTLSQGGVVRKWEKSVLVQ